MTLARRCLFHHRALVPGGHGREVCPVGRHPLWVAIDGDGVVVQCDRQPGAVLAWELFDPLRGRIAGWVLGHEVWWTTSEEQVAMRESGLAPQIAGRDGLGLSARARRLAVKVSVERYLVSRVVGRIRRKSPDSHEG